MMDSRTRDGCGRAMQRIQNEKYVGRSNQRKAGARAYTQLSTIERLNVEIKAK